MTGEQEKALLGKAIRYISLGKDWAHVDGCIQLKGKMGNGMMIRVQVGAARPREALDRT